MGGDEMNPLFEAQWQAILTHKPELSALSTNIRQAFEDLYSRRHKQFDTWLCAIEALALPHHWQVKLNQATVSADAAQVEYQALEDCAQLLMPWRKGPFQLAALDLDCEWRSDMKYQRLLEAGFEVKDKQVLDVGTGNGYFLYRLLGSGATLALGLDPSWHYFAQFLFLQRFMQQSNAAFLPLTLNEAPLTNFDCTLCMGVLYHRRDPLAFISQLRDTLKTSASLVLETLVVAGDSSTVYMPAGRYAGMHNVWFLPSIQALTRWLQRLGFKIDYVSAAVETTSLEQRRTRFMTSHSLAEFLQEAAQQNQQEPPPKRAFVIAHKA